MNFLTAFSNYSQILLSWFFSNGVKIIGIIIGAFIAKWIINFLFEKFIRKLIVADTQGSKDAELKREETLITITKSTTGVVILTLTLLIMLSEIGVDIAPLLAAAGVAGIALGFGGQYLIRDVISGLFVILENQYRVGDVVCFNGTCGVVEDITLRKTTLRDLDGTVHHVPHGEIKLVSNRSKDFARVNIDIGIAYKTKLDHVIDVVNRVGNELAEDTEWKDKIKKAPQFVRVTDFADSAVMIKILGDTEPLQQWAVAGELRKRLKIAFDKEGIEIPFPQRVIHTAV